jgi:short-subunit dehydrogenase
MTDCARPLAVITGASTGIGYELARESLEHGHDIIIAADEPDIEAAAERLRPHGGSVEPVMADLSGEAGVDKLCSMLRGRPVAALLANAGRGLGRGFLDQEPSDWKRAWRRTSPARSC